MYKEPESENLENKKAQAIFCEVFSGKGVLTDAIKKLGIKAEVPNDFQHGGTDFRVSKQVEDLKDRLSVLAAQTHHLVLHLAPPCATFSRARDRSVKTRLRSCWYPEGLPQCRSRTREANLIAKRAYELAGWAADELGAFVSLENPRRSYLWQYLEAFPAADSEWTDVHFSPCLHGAAYQKPTTLRCWNWRPSKLEGVCKATSEGFTCGRTREEGHEVLEFGGRRTSEAAEYAEGVCKKWALCVAEAVSEDAAPEVALDQAQLTEEGRVKRHKARGHDEDTPKEIRAREDAACKAGMRNPADLEEQWPRLWDTMGRVRAVLEKARSDEHGLRDLTALCGEAPSRQPPDEKVLLGVRAKVADLLGVATDDFDHRHPASPWRHCIVHGVQAESDDPDKPMAEWLATGAPMGLASKIECGGLFPQVEPEPKQTLEDLDQQERWEKNHPSFLLEHGEGRPPGLNLIEEYLEKGMGRLYKDAAAASEALGQKIHPAPLGNVTTVKGDKVKHRVIQDLKANGVNASVVLPERQVLPRGIDHALDMARLSAHPKKSEEVSVLILDYIDAFMSIPLAESEKAYNCATLPENAQLKRKALDDTEPSIGKCVVWNVLGFGGKPNPLVYSRVASFAMRTAQAMFSKNGVGPKVRSQLYVDDPAITARGSADEIQLAFDLVLLWWLVLGIPLAWSKGATTRSTEKHVWIGVTYEITEPGVVLMSLPEKYLKDLLEALAPFCSVHGRATIREAERMVGKASRVAQVVPASRPFVSGLWAALTATRKDVCSGRNWTQGRRVATRRFLTAARWFRALVEGDEDTLLPLERRVLAHRPPSATTSGWTVQFDASTTGGGAILRYGHNIYEYFSVAWSKKTAAALQVVPGLPKYQTFWEFLTLLLALMVWANDFKQSQLAVLGDNTGALTNALQLKGKGILAAVAREVAWRRERFNWAFAVGHVPSELNIVPDALSRQFETVAPPFPHAALSAAKARELDLSGVWKAGAR